MKNIQKILFSCMALIMLIAACTKEPPLSLYNSGNIPKIDIKLNTSGIMAPSPEDSNKYSFKVSWVNPLMATSFSNVKFVTEIDFADQDFVNPVRSTVFGTFGDSIQNKILNNFVLSKGVAFGEQAQMKVRVITSYSNNNDRQVSDVYPFKYIPYKVPPRVALPSSKRLFIVGSATEGSWGNPVPTPKQEFARLDETTWGGVFKLYGGAQYLVLPVNGSWDHKYSVANTNLPGLNEGGAFGYDLPGNFPGPGNDGLYKIILDFQQGTFKVEPFTLQHGLPEQLVAVGGATPWGWNNSLDNPQKFKRLNSAIYQLGSIALAANDGYLLLPEPGNWGKKYGVPNNSVPSSRFGGVLTPEGQDFKSPTTAGNYRITVNFVTGLYEVTPL